MKIELREAQTKRWKTVKPRNKGRRSAKQDLANFGDCIVSILGHKMEISKWAERKVNLLLPVTGGITGENVGMEEAR